MEMSLALFRGPISIDLLKDGSLLIAGPNDESVVIKNGKVLRQTDYKENGIVLFTDSPWGARTTTPEK